MSRFDPVDDQYDPHAVEEEIFDYWDAVDAYEQTRDHRADGETYFFVDGPPYTSGSAHMGTTWNKTLKDLYIRYLPLAVGRGTVTRRRHRGPRSHRRPSVAPSGPPGHSGH